MMAIDNPSISNNALDGIAGWLIIIAIGVVFAPLGVAARILIELRRVDGPVIPIAVLAVYLLYQLAIVYFFFAKRRLFPILKIVSLFLSFIIVAVTYYVLGERGDTPRMSPLVGTAAAMCLWVWYLLVSKRVAATFIK